MFLAPIFVENLDAVVEGTAVLSTGETGGVKVLTEQGDGSSAWAEPVAQTPEGTAILSTGEVGGTNFLREDGDNSCSWQPIDFSAYATLLAVFNNQSGTTYTIQASDNGKIVTCDNASAIAVTLPDSLDTNFQCVIVQVGAGVPTVTRSGSDTINGAATGVAPSAQWKGMHLSQFKAAEWIALI